MSGTRENISFLVVEDNDIDAETVTRLLRKMRITNQIVRAVDGMEALDLLSGAEARHLTGESTVILLDINMPRMNGFEFLEELRRDPSFDRTPVVMMTTSDRNQDIDRAHEFEVADYIVKPVRRPDMLDALGRMDLCWTLQVDRSAGTHGPAAFVGGGHAPRSRAL